MSSGWHSQIRKGLPAECWPWTGRVSRDGKVRVGKTLADRLAYEAASGPIPPKHVVVRRCQNRTCMNPTHLEAISVRENRLRQNPPQDRFWTNVEPSGDCWVWMGLKNVEGYGDFSILNRHVLAHRYAFETMRSEIPDGLQLDHLCRVRACVNPWHLEPVTGLVNTRRGEPAQRTACIKGHPYDEANTGWRKNGRRRCLACHREFEKARSERSREVRGVAK